MYLHTIKQSFIAMIFFTILLGVIYPFLIMGIGYTFTPEQTEGSIIKYQGKPVGSSLIGQVSPTGFFQPRPSANNYDALESGGSNLAINNPKQLALISNRIQILQNTYGGQKVPADLVFASGSGLDPDISLQAALYQANHISAVQKLPYQTVIDLIMENRKIHWFNPPTINVLELNIALKPYTS